MSDITAPEHVSGVHRSLAEVRATLKRPRQSVSLVLDGEQGDRIAFLTDALEIAKKRDELSNEPDRAPGIERQLVEAEEAADASRQRFTFQALPHRTYARLIAEHPPTQESLDESAKNEAPPDPFDFDSFAPALIAAMAVEPEGSKDEWLDMWDQLSDGQIALLWKTALTAQLGGGDELPKSDTD